MIFHQGFIHNTEGKFYWIFLDWIIPNLDFGRIITSNWAQTFKMCETLNLNRFDFLLQIPSVCLPHWDVIYSNLESFVKFKQFQVWAATCWVEVPGEAACVSLQLLFNKSIQILAKKSLEILLNKSIQQLYKKMIPICPCKYFSIKPYKHNPISPLVSIGVSVYW